MNCAYKMRRTRIQSDAKNLLFDCPLHQLGCYARSFQARSLRSKYVYAKVMGMPIPVIQCTLGQLGKRLQTRQGCDVVRSSLPVKGGGGIFQARKDPGPRLVGIKPVLDQGPLLLKYQAPDRQCTIMMHTKPGLLWAVFTEWLYYKSKIIFNLYLC